MSRAAPKVRSLYVSHLWLIVLVLTQNSQYLLDLTVFVNLVKQLEPLGLYIKASSWWNLNIQPYSHTQSTVGKITYCSQFFYTLKSLSKYFISTCIYYTHLPPENDD